jgi:hypothetical protein
MSKAEGDSMKTEGAMRERWGMGGRALALMVLVCGLAAGAQQRGLVKVMNVTTTPVSGAVGDTVVASVVDTGIRTGATVTVTLRLLDSLGAVLAQTSGEVNEGTPLRLSYRAASANGISAQVIVPIGGVPLSAPVITLERWSAATVPPPEEPRPPVTCAIPIARPDEDEGPVTLCATDPRCDCNVESLPQ